MKRTDIWSSGMRASQAFLALPCMSLISTPRPLLALKDSTEKGRSVRVNTARQEEHLVTLFYPFEKKGR